MQLRFKVFTVFIVVLIGVMATAQSTLAQIDDPSHDRGLGVGLLWLNLKYPTLAFLSLRLWLGDFLGLEGLFTVIGDEVYTTLAGGGGALLKIINIPFVDLYTAARVLVIRPQIPLPSMITWLVAAGLEVAPLPFFALSFETTLFVSVKFAVPGAGLGGSAYHEFPFIFGGAIHAYF
jgi:hypothetical protein